MTGTREPARSSSATASMFPGVKCPARRCSIPAKGATVASAKDPSPLRYWSRRLHQGIKWRHHPHQVNYNSTATADITLSVLEEQKISQDKAYPFSVSLWLVWCYSLVRTLPRGCLRFPQREAHFALLQTYTTITLERGKKNRMHFLNVLTALRS